MTLPQVEAMFGICAGTVRTWVRRGFLPEIAGKARRSWKRLTWDEVQRVVLFAYLSEDARQEAVASHVRRLMLTPEDEDGTRSIPVGNGGSLHMNIEACLAEMAARHSSRPGADR
ncbi:hypothetical protein [Methylorubrum thiocyanatum]